MILVLSLSHDISQLKPCDLETALDSIYLEFTPHPCKYNAIQEMAEEIQTLAGFQFCWMFTLLFSIPRVIWLAPEKKKKRLTVFILVVIVSTFVHLSFFLLVFLSLFLFKNEKNMKINHTFMEK